LSRNATISLGVASPGALSLVSRESVTGGVRANAGAISPGTRTVAGRSFSEA